MLFIESLTTLYDYGVYTHEQVTQAIVVLGYMLNPDGTMKVGLIHRLDTAAELYNEGVAPVIITSGWYAIDVPELSQYYEALIMRHYLHQVHGSDMVVMCESDSTSVPENLLFTRERFVNLQQITIVAGERFIDRVAYFAHLIFAGRAEVNVHACVDNAGDLTKQRLLIGDAICTLKNRTIDDLLLPPAPDGRLRSRWNEWRLEHHNCPYWGSLHP